MLATCTGFSSTVKITIGQTLKLPKVNTLSYLRFALRINVPWDLIWIQDNFKISMFLREENYDFHRFRMFFLAAIDINRTLISTACSILGKIQQNRTIIRKWKSAQELLSSKKFSAISEYLSRNIYLFSPLSCNEFYFFITIYYYILEMIHRRFFTNFSVFPIRFTARVLRDQRTVESQYVTTDRSFHETD